MNEELHRVKCLAIQHGYEVGDYDGTGKNQLLFDGAPAVPKLKLKTLAEIEAFLNSPQAQEVEALHKRWDVIVDEIKRLLGQTSWGHDVDAAFTCANIGIDELELNVKDWGGPTNRRRIGELLFEQENICDALFGQEPEVTEYSRKWHEEWLAARKQDEQESSGGVS